MSFDIGLISIHAIRGQAVEAPLCPALIDAAIGSGKSAGNLVIVASIFEAASAALALGLSHSTISRLH